MSFERPPRLTFCSVATLDLGPSAFNPVSDLGLQWPVHESFAERNANWMDLCPQEAPSSGITALHSGPHR